MRIWLLVVSAALLEAQPPALKQFYDQLPTQASDPKWIRKGGTLPEDWPYRLPEGVTTRQVVFYSDGTQCVGKLFFPKGFSRAGKTPGIVLGHGFNGIAIGVEKYAARFAERGFVSFVIDYRTYGFSSGQVSLLEADPSTDAVPVTQRFARVRLKRTRLHHFRQIEDYRAAISFLQGEPGVDPARIGIWGSSNSGAEVISVAGLDARVRAVVAQVSVVGGRNASGPAPIPPNLIEDAILRARTGQGAEVDGGFSFRTKIDLETTQTGREHRPWSFLTRIPESTAILWIPAEKDELTPPRSPSGPYEASKVFTGVSRVEEIPHITHFQAYSGPAFEISSAHAANWFEKHLVSRPTPPRAVLPRLPSSALRTVAPLRLPSSVTARDVWFYSEGIQCYGRLFLPAEASGKLPAVILPPDWGQTHESRSAEAAALAAAGLAALAIDYRGWGKSGAYLYAERIAADDRFRFLETTLNVEFRRRRLVPQHQIEDIRNAIGFLQGEPSVDPKRVSIWGHGLSAGHALAIAAVDARVAAIAVTSPLVPGQDAPERAQLPHAEVEAAAIRLARSGFPQSPSPMESVVAFADYQPFRDLAQIPAATPVRIWVLPQQESEARNLTRPIKSQPIVSVVSPGGVAEQVAAWLRQQVN